MLKSITKLFTRPAAPLPAVPDGTRVYAIGDIHGRLDLFGALVDAIEADDRSSGAAQTTVILLGDLVDRGPDSAGVIDLARSWLGRRNVRILAGNHEEMFLGSFERVEVLRQFIRHGGRETILSYGMAADVYDRATLEELQEAMHALVPVDHCAFLRGLEDRIIMGDYLFVHAGILPGVEPEAQKLADLRWIREPFLSHTTPHSHVVVHGHTITEQVETRPNRIGIDTGGYCHGRLTALVLEGTARRFISAVEQGGNVSIKAQTA